MKRIAVVIVAMVILLLTINAEASMFHIKMPSWDFGLRKVSHGIRGVFSQPKIVDFDRLLWWDHNNSRTLSVSNDDTSNAVPIPAAVYLLGTGIIGLVLLKRRKVTQ